MDNKVLHRFSFVILISILLISCGKRNLTINLDLKTTSPQTDYAVGKFKELQQKNTIAFSDNRADITIKATIDTINLKSEAYRIVSQNNRVEITGGDAVGLMYGLLEVKYLRFILPIRSKPFANWR